MNVAKLTITPINKGITPFIEYNPKSDIAATLIKERLASGRNKEIPSIMRRVPTFLKGLVNPETKVVRNNNFNSLV